MANPEQKRTKIEIPSLSEEQAEFRRRIIGQNEAVEAFSVLLAKLRSGIRSAKPGPIDIKFLAGPSGVGKTEMVYTLAELLAKGEDNPRAKVIKINGGEYYDRYLVSRLIGAPPGYRGSEDPHYPNFKSPALFTPENLASSRINYVDKTGARKDTVIILVDEAEKADESLHRAFLSVLDKGEMTTGDNKRSDFSNAVIFYTSNVGNQDVERLSQLQGRPVEAQSAQNIMSEAFKNAFPPEFRGRIKDLIIFEHLDVEAIKKITEMNIRRIEENFAQNGIAIALELSPAALTWIINQGYSPSEGARALEKVIDARVQDRLILVSGSIQRKRIYADLEDGEAELSFYFNEGEQLPDISRYPQLARTAPVQSTRTVQAAAKSLPPTTAKESPVQPVKQIQPEKQDIQNLQEEAYENLKALFKGKPLSRDLARTKSLSEESAGLLELIGVPEKTKVTVWWEQLRSHRSIMFDEEPEIRRLVLRWDTISRSDIAAIALEIDPTMPPRGPKLKDISIFSNEKESPLILELSAYEGSYIRTKRVTNQRTDKIIGAIHSLPQDRQIAIITGISRFLLNG